MTRFARAKGSKASNERLPNEPTPWHVMKQQLEDNLYKSEEPTKKAKTAKQLLQEKQEPFYYSTTGNTNTDWAEFEETKSRKPQKKEKEKVKKNKTASIDERNNLKGSEKSQDESGIETIPSAKRKSDEIDNNSTIETASRKQKKTNKLHGNEVVNTNTVEPEQCEKQEENHKASKERKQDKQLIQNSIGSEFQTEKDGDNTSNDTNNVANQQDTKQEFDKFSKRQKRNMKRSKNGPTYNNQSSSAFNVTGNDWTTSVNSNGDRRNYNDQRFDRNPMERQYNYNNKPNNFGNRRFENQNTNNKRKLPKVRDDKEHKRRKPEVGPTKMIINGTEVEIVKYDGFPVRKEDADRLSDLKQKMIMKGIPQSDINTAMKLERRKAEKALARIKKCVCFHCRKSGHNLSDCPELGSEQAGTGICFKCGSTEHTHFECKVAKATEYRFATCFICREQGHIAKQCPDNPKGIYPQGGACKVCGDVTHLKKDCPDLARENEETAITLDTITNSTLESLENNTRKINEGIQNSSKKIVKF